VYGSPPFSSKGLPSTVPSRSTVDLRLKSFDGEVGRVAGGVDKIKRRKKNAPDPYAEFNEISREQVKETLHLVEEKLIRMSSSGKNLLGEGSAVGNGHGGNEDRVSRENMDAHESVLSQYTDRTHEFDGRMSASHNYGNHHDYHDVDRVHEGELQQYHKMHTSGNNNATSTSMSRPSIPPLLTPNVHLDKTDPFGRPPGFVLGIGQEKSSAGEAPFRDLDGYGVNGPSSLHTMERSLLLDKSVCDKMQVFVCVCMYMCV
jgi:hypothetical protein